MKKTTMHFLLVCMLFLFSNMLHAQDFESCFETAQSMFDLTGADGEADIGHCFDGDPPFDDVSSDGTLDNGVDCYLDLLYDCGGEFTHQEIVDYSYGCDNGDIEPDIWQVCDGSGGGGPYTPADQVAMLETTIAFANEHAPICPDTGEPKVVEDIEFYIGWTSDVNSCYWVQIALKYACLNCCPPSISSQFTIDEYECLEDTYNVTVTANDPVPSQWWRVYETSVEGQTSDAVTIGPASNIQGGTSTTFTGLDPNKFYYIKHGVWIPNCFTWQETRKPLDSGCCTPKPITITANGVDITNTLTYTIPCGESCVTINATNVENAVYNSSDPVLTDLNGLFCVPGSSLTSFTANITGVDSCGNPYSQNIAVNLEQDCCLDEPYVEPHWELCETNNVCELDSWPIRVLDGNTPLLLLDGYTFSWTLNGVEISTSDILYGAVEDQTYEVTVTYPNGCEYTISYLEVCCVPEAVTITANGEDITDTLTYTIPCGENCVTINATNVENAVYNTSDPVLTDLNGLFCVPPGSSLTSFTANITGFDTCGDPYSESVTVLIEQDCCLDDISVVFDECPDEEVATLASFNGLESRATNTIVSKSDAERAFTILERSKEALKDCDPCESGVVSTTVVDSNGDPITNFETINVSWAGNPSGVDVNTNQFLVYVDVLYTVTVTVIDPAGHECVYTFDFIYECETKECDGLTAPSNLQAIGSDLTWDPVPGAVSYIISSPSVIKIECCRLGVSIAPITTTFTTHTLPLSLQSKCFVWQVTAICADGTTSPVSTQACHLPTLRLADDTTSNDKVSIYPNPNKGQMDVRVEIEGISFVELKIYRYDGLLVKTINKEKSGKGVIEFGLDLNLPTGLYLFNFKTLNGVITKRVVIE
ncbi:T9SS type A sorting domain-containing protein [uncultured Psychroserpens sp.]|uniref:T9SS type A sorting domain-containing protein n=1 Tax=uncultured Psychroserpens sp. TaxID=255436 RepID=UPI002622F360|nr:T9SS type A sorting domain-containing protein [uncultured Psychroserpens sp.]